MRRKSFFTLGYEYHERQPNADPFSRAKELLAKVKPWFQDQWIDGFLFARQREKKRKDAGQC